MCLKWRHKVLADSGEKTHRGTFYKSTVVIAHAVVGWAFCGTLVGVGRRYLPMQTTLVLHAIGAPLGFALISYFYYRRFSVHSSAFLWTLC